MRLLAWYLTVLMLAASAQGCAKNGSVAAAQQQAAMSVQMAAQKDGIVDRLIPEDGLTFTRRSRLIDATIAVLGKGDREELQNVSNLRSTLRAASVENLEKIEANYKERMAEGQ